MIGLKKTHFRGITLFIVAISWSSGSSEAISNTYQKPEPQVTNEILILQPSRTVEQYGTPKMNFFVRELSQTITESTDDASNNTVAGERTKVTRAVTQPRSNEHREINLLREYQNKDHHTYYRTHYYTTEYSYQKLDRFHQEIGTTYSVNLEAETTDISDVVTRTHDFNTQTVTHIRVNDDSSVQAIIPMSSNYATMGVIESMNSVIVELPLSALSTGIIVNNKLDEFEQYHTENKDLRHVIKPTPSQINVDTDSDSFASFGGSEVVSRSYLTEDQRSNVVLPGKEQNYKLITQSLNAVPKPEVKPGKTPDLKTSEISADTVSGSSLTTLILMTTVTSSSRPVVETESYSNNEIPNPVSVSGLIPDRRNNTVHHVPEPRRPSTDSLSLSASTTDPSPFQGNSCLPNAVSCTGLIKLTLSFTWSDFCLGTKLYTNLLALMIKTGDNNANATQDASDLIVLMDSDHCADSNERREMDGIQLAIYVKNSAGKIDRRLTRQLWQNLFNKDKCRNPDLCPKITYVSLQNDEGSSGDLTSSSPLVLSGGGMVIGVAVSVLAAIFLVSLAAMMTRMKLNTGKANDPAGDYITANFVRFVLKQRSKSKSSSLSHPGGRTRASFDAYSLDSFSTGHRKRRSRLSLRSFLNQAFEDPDVPNRPLSFNNLTNVLTNKSFLEEEFKKLPVIMPMLDTVPSGAETKNRYANVIPVPETRVKLNTGKANDPVGDYINANFVRGYGGKNNAYIACQAPLPDTVEDFWRMVWEQQSRMILMLTQLQENGAIRCEPYFPENTLDCHRLYGDFQVSLQNKDVREHFTVSTLRLYEMEKNLFRDVVHLWYRTWPPHGVPPDPSTILSFMMETRNHSQRNAGPIVVHCSPGTGRTGTAMALDWCMREYDESRVVDVQRCICRLRQDRAGAVQTHLQYILIHEVLHEFILKMGTQSQRPSLKSLMSFKLSH